MALVPCIECKREISDSAQSCPHCGKPIPTFKAASTTGWAFLVSVALVAAFGFWVWRSIAQPVGAEVGSSDASFALIVNCAPGTRFQGTLLTFKSSGASTTSDVSGRCPSSGSASFSVTGYMVSTSVQKQGADHTRLSVTISRTGRGTVAQSETTNPFGVITAASPP